MKGKLAVCLMLVAVSAATAALARPPAPARILQGADITERPAFTDPTLATEASSDTFVFGPWDFETSWQGWSALDYNVNTSVYPHVQNLASVPGSAGNGTLFTGLVAWDGTLGSNACGYKACFPGYDNNSNQMIFKSYTFGAGAHSLTYKYRADSEPGYDYTRVIISRAGCPTLQGDGSYKYPGTETDRDTLVEYTGAVEGSETIDLSAYANKTVCIVFQSNADGGYSDGDCNYDSADGLFEMDNTQVDADLTTWDSGNNGWTFAKGSGLGTHAQRETLSGLPNADPCPTFCGLAGQVVTIYDPTDPNFHAVNQNEAIISPTVDLTVNTKYPVGSYVIQFDVYANLPLQNGNFYFWHVRYQPVENENCSCTDPNDWSTWLDENTIYYGGGIPACGTAFQFNVSAKIPGHANHVQLAVGVLNYPYYASVPGGNQSPYFDNISLRAANVSAPAIVNYAGDFLQDAYPDAATFATAKSTPAKMDNAINNFSPGRSHTREGDSTVASVALGCTRQVEVDYLLKVTPGPCMNLSHPWWVAYNAQPKIASGPYAGFAVARLDTAVTFPGGNRTVQASAGFAVMMSEFNELPPAAGTTYAGLGNWNSYTGGIEGKAIWPDDLFTPGTHIEYVQHTTFIPVLANGDYYEPSTKYGDGDGDRVGDTFGNEQWASDGGTPAGNYNPAGTFVREASVLPLTTTDGTTNCAGALPAHCLLYVDKWDNRGPQYNIENAFRNLRIKWDRYDVTNSTGSMGNDLGSRFDPSNYANGDHAPGPLPSLLNEVYKSIVWNSGSNTSNNISYGSTASGADAGNGVGLIDGFLRTTTDGKAFHADGNGFAQFLNRTGTRLTFLNTTLGVTYIGAQYRDQNTAWGFNLTGVGLAAGFNLGLGQNWCPERASYNKLDVYTGSGITGAPQVLHKYPDAPAGTPWNATIVNRAQTGGFNFITLTSGHSLERTRQLNPVFGTNYQDVIDAVRFYVDNLHNPYLGNCFPDLSTVAVGDQGGTIFENSLANPAKNPALAGPLQIAYSLKSAGHVAVRVYDVSGRLVSTLVDRNEAAGSHTATWNTSGAKGGVYFYQIETNGFKSAKKIVLVN